MEELAIYVALFIVGYILFQLLAVSAKAERIYNTAV